MTGDRERFGEEVGDVVETADEEDTKVSLADPVSDPMQSHVRCLRHPLGDRVGSNADSHLVVTKQRGGGLGVAHVGQDFAFLCRDASSGVQTSVLRLRDKGTVNRDAGGMEPKKALSETTELKRMLTVGREATWVEGGQEEGRQSPPAVPRTRQCERYEHEIDYRLWDIGSSKSL
jgi:hypothetical protein